MRKVPVLSTFFVALILSVGLCSVGLYAAPPDSVPKTPKTRPTRTGILPVDINSAPLDELKTVPEIGDAYAGRIIAGRPYKNKAQLKTRGILPEAVYEKTKDNLVAKQKK